MLDKTALERRREYLVCKDRGHKASSVVLDSMPPLSVCEKCGTQYRFVTTVQEYNVPYRTLCEREHYKGVKCPDEDCSW